MADEKFEFSVSRHVDFLQGYLDAVGRVLTTESELWCLTLRYVEDALENDHVIRAAVRTGTVVENWSREFGWLVDEFLAIDERSRLGFYLVDYICWFHEFTNNAECSKIDCEFLREGTVSQAVYLLQLEQDRSVLLIVQRLDKTHNKPLQPIAAMNAAPAERRR
jgi:hypothetical protein